uniref:NADH dehydrogenase [ubiquinone] 1 beta subcomplex subunit 5, mitochondrial n=1 Tax=Petromyzon marinus TaxID=7757 RepID=A0AAJ7THQ2_PETMA|nr:NADH dehydrogenase [ubiquinone] 1 beta subcomplex subunit 5, mitochondrial isoform X1 [Petromyzon marinus]
MAVLSVLRAALRGASSSLFSAATASSSSSSAASATSPLRCLLGRVPAGHVRYSSGSSKRLFFIEPTKYFDNRFLNLTIFYLALTGVPAAIIITYINVFVGEAKLAEIPEGYIPENYEYHKHPITRWIVKHVLDPPEKNYEKDMHLIAKEMEKSHHYAIEAKARRLMRDRGDGPWSVMPVQDPAVIIRHHKATPDD